jgi:hypothetical protein
VRIESLCNAGDIEVSGDCTVATQWDGDESHFAIERPDEERELYAFRHIATNLYLSAPLYGEKANRAIGEALHDATPIVPDLIPSILEFCGVVHAKGERIFAQSGPLNEYSEYYYRALQ